MKTWLCLDEDTFYILHAHCQQRIIIIIFIIHVFPQGEKWGL